MEFVIEARFTEEEKAQYAEVAAVLDKLVEEICEEQNLYDELAHHLSMKITRRFPQLNGFQFIGQGHLGSLQLRKGKAVYSYGKAIMNRIDQLKQLEDQIQEHVANHDFEAAMKLRTECTDLKNSPITQHEIEQFNAVLECLNSAYKADPVAMHALNSLRFPTNEAMLNHPHVEVANHQMFPGYTVGVLGLINGVMRAMGLPNIASKWEKKDAETGRMELVGFGPEKE